ncbi:MAG: polysulfide reductase NrfD [Bacteroidetes bacterium]|nr:polysulfide reductase NrfD [Rhodothermia bacterium]MCS7154919.1 polysulfide reductase NrfD [Bacteroidota bacterium]MCX7906922.1 polysulfide reductase NrfD [Bacteroidota bacterium]MDW8137714.1 NrfD/PsrC family molybdoenzyme membrane anchor subunit [Bacteroidota bacterium]MDW8285332.1 NrfD/PsrC family molybdoenzyme membrane anchor subunit [Bacteroidota bacterium]
MSTDRATESILVNGDRYDGLAAEPAIVPEHLRLHDVTRDVARPLEAKPGPLWYLAFGAAVLSLGIGVWVVYNMFSRGLGVLGYNHPVMWATPITNFVFWVGIGHAGTLISAILFLLRQRWRTSINRTAEAMTIFAVICAAIFPIIHIGRPWLAFWLIPYPNERLLWVNFRSPLVWDVFAVTTYFLTSLMFWYQGLIPDLATIRDRATGWKKKIYGFLAFGWQGTARQWNHYERAYAQFAWIATPLVLSVHSVVSFDFAVSLVPGWHTTIFPPYFVAGAIFSGFGMVLTLMVIMRKVFRLEEYVTPRHIDLMCKVTLATSMMVGFAYGTEFFMAWWSEDPFERFIFANRPTGEYAWAFWIMVISNVVVPQLFWFRRIRYNMVAVFLISIVVNIGMWFERYNIIVTSLYKDFLPSNWMYFVPNIWDIGLLLGSFGLFFTLFLLFAKFFPTIAIAEVKTVLKEPYRKAVEQTQRA